LLFHPLNSRHPGIDDVARLRAGRKQQHVDAHVFAALNIFVRHRFGRGSDPAQAEFVDRKIELCGAAPPFHFDEHNDGSIALNRAIQAIKADGRAVLIMAHRPSAIRECDRLLVLSGGTPVMFGPTQEVLQKTLANFSDIKTAAIGGVS
jgi:hypothetical protein